VPLTLDAEAFWHLECKRFCIKSRNGSHITKKPAALLRRAFALLERLSAVSTCPFYFIAAASSFSPKVYALRRLRHPGAANTSAKLPGETPRVSGFARRFNGLGPAYHA
jgi:hypothetical protein